MNELTAEQKRFRTEIYRATTSDIGRPYWNFIASKADGVCHQFDISFDEKSFEIGSDSRCGRVESVCNAYGVPCRVVGSQTGPVISKIFIKLAVGVQCSRLESITKDLARDIGVKSIVVDGNDSFAFSDPYTGERLERCCSLSIPATDRKVVPFGNVFNHPADRLEIPAVIGVDPVGAPVQIDLARTPHMLIAGQTGSGKSVCVNSIISSVYLSMAPSKVRFLLVDPKQVELKAYEPLPNLVNGRIITDSREAVDALGWLVSLMEHRYSFLAKTGFKSIKDFNDAVNDPDKILKIPAGSRQEMPYIVTVVDEFADLMMTAPADLTAHVMRIAQKARAVGIHLILATQRPSTKVITGDLKCNIPTRIAFKVASAVDSVTILGTGGAEKLLGMGDMIMTGYGSGDQFQRCHGCYLSNDEIGKVVAASGQDAKFEFDDLATFTGVDFAEPFAKASPNVPKWVADIVALARNGLLPRALKDSRTDAEIYDAVYRITGRSK